jgi:hypothetical protein
MPESHERALPATEVVLWLLVFQTQSIVSPTLIETLDGENAKLMTSTSTVLRRVRASSDPRSGSSLRPGPRRPRRPPRIRRPMPRSRPDLTMETNTLTVLGLMDSGRVVGHSWHPARHRRRSSTRASAPPPAPVQALTSPSLTSGSWPPSDPPTGSRSPTARGCPACPG